MEKTIIIFLCFRNEVFINFLNHQKIWIGIVSSTLMKNIMNITTLFIYLQQLVQIKLLQFLNQGLTKFRFTKV
jgi:hypothetical protein